jgi:iron(III) transport system substrate-binding protein
MLELGTLKSLFVIFILSIVLAAAACTANNTEEINKAVTEAVAEEKARVLSETQAVETKAAKPLIIYSGRSESLVGPIIKQFRDATGYTVKVKYANTGQLAATLLEEGAKSPADIFFAQDSGGLGRVEVQLSNLPSSILKLAPTWARSKNGKWVGTSGRARTVVYNSNTISPSDLPNDLGGFTKHEWKGRIGWAPTNASFQAMVTGMRVLWGEDKTKEWLVAMQANEPKVYPTNTAQVAATAAGEIDVGLVNHYYLHRFISAEGEDFAARNYHPRGGGPGALVMVAGAGVLESSDNKEKAQEFIRFMLSKVAQQYFASQTYEYPLIDGVKTPLTLVPFPDIKSPSLSANDLTDHDGTIKLLQATNVLP